VFEFHLLVVELFFAPFPVLDSQFFEGVVVASVVVEFLVVEVDGFVAGDVEELAGVGDDHHCAFAVADVVLEPHNGVQIQMVGRFVEQ
jgi:hypothetical protein